MPEDLCGTQQTWSRKEKSSLFLATLKHLCSLKAFTFFIPGAWGSQGKELASGVGNFHPIILSW